MPFDDDLDALLNEENLRMEVFSEEIRQQMRALMRDIEQEFQEFLEQVLGEQIARFESEAEAMFAQRDIPVLGGEVAGGISDVIESVFGQNTDSLIGKALGSAFGAAMTSVTSGRGFNPRSVASAGARSIGRTLGNNVVKTIGSSRPDASHMRLSRGQLSHNIAETTARGPRNS